MTGPLSGHTAAKQAAPGQVVGADGTTAAALVNSALSGLARLGDGQRDCKSSAGRTAPLATPARTELRPDLQLIAGFIPEATKVLDLGCGDGALLDHLVRSKQAKGRGIELSEEGMLACVRRGLSVRQGDLQEGLADYPDRSFDYVVLSQTLPFLDDPEMILREMLRVASRAVVSFPNWGYWGCRLELLLTGRIPQARDLPQSWHEKPRWQAFSVTDFALFCRQAGIRIARQAYLSGGRPVTIPKFKNLFSITAVFVLER
jgi:methionine biosynthesis protein MetW